MKTLNLNSILALILSLGMTCSGFAFAAEINVKTPVKLSGKPVQILKKRDITNSDMAATCLKKSSTKCKTQKRAEPVCGEKLERSLDAKLANLFLLSKKWRGKIKTSFDNNGWKEFAKLYHSKYCTYSAKFVENFKVDMNQFLEILKSLKKCSRENNLKDENEIFKSLIKNCNEIKKKLSEKN